MHKCSVLINSGLKRETNNVLLSYFVGFQVVINKLPPILHRIGGNLKIILNLYDGATSVSRNCFRLRLKNYENAFQWKADQLNDLCYRDPRSLILTARL